MATVWQCEAITDRMELLVLLALADWSDDRGRSFPSMDHLALKARISRRKCYSVVAALEERGWLDREAREGRSSIITLHLDQLGRYPVDLEAAADGTANDQADGGVHHVHTPTEADDPGGAPRAQGCAYGCTGVCTLVHTDTSLIHHLTVTTPPAAAAGDEGGQLVVFPGTPTDVVQANPYTTQLLVKAWHDAYTAANGRKAQPAAGKRVAGHVGQLTRALAADDLDAWRDAWRLCSAAGRVGRFDVVAFSLTHSPDGQATAPAAAASRSVGHLIQLTADLKAME
jgi:hypothetical protein